MTRSGAWWLTSSHHVVADEVTAPPAVVRTLYCDPQTIVRMHPLVTSVQVTDRIETADAQTDAYRIRDRIPFGPFTLRVVYRARIVVPRHGDVLTEARQFPHVFLRGRVSFDGVGGRTVITERLDITAPRPLAAITVREAVTAHAELLAGIRRYFA